MSTLRDQIRTDPACADALAAKDCGELARLASIGKFRFNTREIGNGTILEVLGLEAGNKLLDLINDNLMFRHVKPLVDQGRLLIGSGLVRATVQSLVPATLTQAQADSLLSLGKEPMQYTVTEVAEALFNADGSEK